MTELRIDKVEVIDCSEFAGPGDDAHVVAVHAAGLTGWYGPVSTAVAALIDTHVGPLVVGAVVAEHEALIARVRPHLGSPVGALTSWAVGALDCAVWDLHGRAESRTVAALLGSSPTTEAVPAYASWLRLEIEVETNAVEIARLAGEGWQFTKWSLRPHPHRQVAADAVRLARLVRQVADVTGGTAAFDALWTWDDELALGFAAAVDYEKMIWLEEPLNTYDLRRYTSLAATSPPLALGERLHLGDDPTAMLGLPGLRALTLDVVGCGGLTAALHLTRLAATAGIPVYPHGRSLVPAVHLAAALPEAVGAVEYQVQWEPRRRRLFTDPFHCDAGKIPVPRSPGLGPVPRRR